MQLKMTVFTTCAKSYKEGLEYLLVEILTKDFSKKKHVIFNFFEFWPLF